MSNSLVGIYSNISYALNLHTAAMANLQEQASTGSRINRISDDPSAAYQVLNLNSQKRSLENYIDSIAQADDVLQVSSNVVASMLSSMSEVQTNLMQITSGTYTQEGRERIAGQVNDILEQMVSLANTRNVNQYIFSGGKTSTAPYAVTRSNLDITSVDYQGSDQAQTIAVADSVRTSLLYSGEEMFSSDDRSSPVFYGDTNAGGGSGTSSVKGDVWLDVTEDATNYYMSIDGGTTTTTVAKATQGSATNVAVENADGQVLYVNASSITQTGKNLVRVPGTYDVFNSLISIRDILRNEQNLSPSQLTEFRGYVTQSIDEVSNHLTSQQILLGSKMGFLEDLKSSIENMQINVDEQTTNLSEADVTQIAIDLSKRETLYQMSLSVAGKLLSVSLLDFLE